MNTELKAIEKIEDITNIKPQIYLNWPYQKGKRTIFLKYEFKNSNLVSFLYQEVRNNLSYFKDLGYEIYFRNNKTIFSIALIPSYQQLNEQIQKSYSKPNGETFEDKRIQRYVKKALWKNLPKAA